MGEESGPSALLAVAAHVGALASVLEGAAAFQQRGQDEAWASHAREGEDGAGTELLQEKASREPGDATGMVDGSSGSSAGGDGGGGTGIRGATNTAGEGGSSGAGSGSAGSSGTSSSNGTGRAGGLPHGNVKKGPLLRSVRLAMAEAFSRKPFGSLIMQAPDSPRVSQGSGSNGSAGGARPVRASQAGSRSSLSGLRTSQAGLAALGSSKL